MIDNSFEDTPFAKGYLIEEITNFYAIFIAEDFRLKSVQYS